MPPSCGRDHGGFDAVFGRAAINDERDASRQFLHHICRGRRADTSKAIGARRRERLAETLHHLREKRMRAHSNRDRRSGPRSRATESIRFGRTIVRGPGQNFVNRSIKGRSFHRSPPPFPASQLRQMDNQRIEMRTFFVSKIFTTASCGKSVRRQAVDCLGRQSDDFARSQQIDRPRDVAPDR